MVCFMSSIMVPGPLKLGAKANYRFTLKALEVDEKRK